MAVSFKGPFPTGYYPHGRAMGVMLQEWQAI
jgi:hypothetical protein